MKMIFFVLFALSLASASNGKRSSISGELNYPAEILPPLKVCAVEITSQIEKCITSKQAQTTYKIQVEPGRYHVYASIIKPLGDIKSTYRAYYTDFVVCGLKRSCPSHEIIEVTVTEGSETKNINPQDWSR